MADPLKLSRVTNPQELLYTLLAVSHAPQPELLLSGVRCPAPPRGQAVLPCHSACHPALLVYRDQALADSSLILALVCP